MSDQHGWTRPLVMGVSLWIVQFKYPITIALCYDYKEFSSPFMDTNIHCPSVMIISLSIFVWLKDFVAISFSYCFKPLALRLSLKSIVCFYHIFFNNLWIKRKFKKNLRESCCLASDQHFFFKMFSFSVKLISISLSSLTLHIDHTPVYNKNYIHQYVNGLFNPQYVSLFAWFGWFLLSCLGTWTMLTALDFSMSPVYQ